MADKPRHKIRHYTLNDVKDLKLIGQGGQAGVYVGKIEDFGQIAVKQFIGELHYSACKKEIELLIQERHPNIVQVFGVISNTPTDPRYTGYIMEYIEGGSLDNVIHQGPKYDLLQISRWITQTARGLQFLHKYGIIHRDIKPANILVCGNQLKLADFGVARNIDTSTTAGAGTPRYMAPEVLSSGKCSPSSDIYALGITIWEIFHRKRPFHEVGEDNGVQPLVYKIMEGVRPTVESDKIDGDVTALLQRCWQEVPDYRPQIKEIVDHFEKTDISSSSQLDVHTAVKELLERGLDVSIILEQPDRDMNELQEILTALMMADTSANQNGKKHNNGANGIQPIPVIKWGPNYSRNETILILGGVKGNERCDDILLLINSEWSKMPLKMPIKTTGHGTVYVNGQIYIIGGNLRNQTAKLGESLKWVRMADMNDRREYITNSCLEWNGYIWVFGGYSDFEVTQTLKSVERYDPRRNKWTEMPSMNHARSHAAAAVWNGKVIICGGICSMYTLRSSECFGPKSGVWTQLDDLPSPLSAHALIPYRNRLILLGGWDGNIWSNSVMALSNVDNKQKWKKLSSLKHGRERFSAVIFNDEIYVIGGWNGTKSLSETEIFDGRKWRGEANLFQQRALMSAVIIPQYFPSIY